MEHLSARTHHLVSAERHPVNRIYEQYISSGQCFQEGTTLADHVSLMHHSCKGSDRRAHTFQFMMEVNPIKNFESVIDIESREHGERQGSSSMRRTDRRSVANLAFTILRTTGGTIVLFFFFLFFSRYKPVCPGDYCTSRV